MAEQEVLTREVVRDGILVAGPDALSWLQGQLTQDVGDLAVGASRLSLVLSPQGKIESFCRVTRTGEEELLLDVERGFGESLGERLRRFKLRVKATLQAVTVLSEEEAGGGYEALGPPQIVEEPQAAGGEDASEPGFESSRILAGVPRLGRELNERTIPQEAGDEFIRRTVSFTKGCFTGQELVARLDSRGSNVPRRLRLARGSGDGGDAPSPGDAIEIEGAEIGELTSVAPLGASWVALGLVKRAALSDQPVEAAVKLAGGALAPAVLTPLGPGAEAT